MEWFRSSSNGHRGTELAGGRHSHLLRGWHHIFSRASERIGLPSDSPLQGNDVFIYAGVLIQRSLVPVQSAILSVKGRSSLLQLQLGTPRVAVSTRWPSREFQEDDIKSAHQCTAHFCKTKRYFICANGNPVPGNTTPVRCRPGPACTSTYSSLRCSPWAEGESPRGAGPLGRRGACPLLGQKRPPLATGAALGIGGVSGPGERYAGSGGLFLPFRCRAANRSTSRRRRSRRAFPRGYIDQFHAQANPRSDWTGR